MSRLLVIACACVAWACVACGRLGFDTHELDDNPNPDADADADAIDADPDALPIQACTVASCPTGFVRADTGCYKVVMTPRAWIDAERDCESYGAHLVVSDDVAEHFTLHDDLAAGIPRIWIGWSDQIVENDWRWVGPSRGELLPSNPCVFGTGEPDTGDNARCAVMAGTNSCGDHFDEPCGDPFPYVCECDGNLADQSAF